MKTLGVLLVLAILWGFAATSCEAQKITTPGRYGWPPPGATEVRPDSLWLVQYAEAERCLGWKGAADSVRWYIVPGPAFHDDEGRSVIGYWVKPHKIYLADGMKGLRWLARHESLHDLMQNGMHPTGVFGKLCAAAWGYLSANGDLGE
jgi:hypothetical protein